VLDLDPRVQVNTGFMLVLADTETWRVEYSENRMIYEGEVRLVD